MNEVSSGNGALKTSAVCASDSTKCEDVSKHLMSEWLVIVEPVRDSVYQAMQSTRIAWYDAVEETMSEANIGNISEQQRQTILQHLEEKAKEDAALCKYWAAVFLSDASHLAGSL